MLNCLRCHWRHDGKVAKYEKKEQNNSCCMDCFLSYSTIIFL